MDLAERAGVRQSVGRVADCFDNALAESFFAMLEGELLYMRSRPTRPETRSALVHWIEGVYNRRRRHSSIGYWFRWCTRSGIRYSTMQPNNAVHQNGAVPSLQESRGGSASCSGRRRYCRCSGCRCRFSKHVLIDDFAPLAHKQHMHLVIAKSIPVFLSQRNQCLCDGFIDS